MQNGEFVLFADALHRHVTEMVKNETHLFRTDVSKDGMWEHYLNSFPEGSNPVFRERREFDCGCCRQFIKAFGNVVAIKGNKVVTIWEDIEILEYPYNIVAAAMTEYIKSKPVFEVFVSRETKFGTRSNKERSLADGSILTWHHFYTELPAAFAITRGSSPESVMAEYRSAREVFERSMLELTEEAGSTVLELIQQGSLYRGEEHKRAVETFLDFKRKFAKVPEADRNNWLWKTSIDNPVSRIRNTAIGTLLIDLSADMDIDEAVTKFEKVMAPTNYKRPKALFTKRMVEEAEKTLVELGMVESLERRHATLSDITVNNVLFVNRDAKKKMEGSSVLASLKEDTAVVNPKTFKRVEEISIQDFIKNVMPGSKRIELLMEGRLRGNLMSLVAPKFKDAKSMFRWDNNFSWSYSGDVADSMMKANVEKAGGRVDGVLRFSIQWNDGEKPNGNDYDAHCKGPDGEHIYYGSKRGFNTGGVLDVDIQIPHGVAVENITWADFSRMNNGEYVFSVHNYNHRGGTDGFDAELEFDGQVHNFSYRKDLKHKDMVEVAVVRYDRKTGISLVRSMDSTLSVKQIWGVTTNKWVDVSTIMFSPNYWDEQTGRGNRHFFFMLEGCRNEGTPRGFYNEFLKEDLNKHKRVFEALGGRAAVKDSEEQLSGVGFSETQRNSVFVKVEGTVSRILKINF